MGRKWKPKPPEIEWQQCPKDPQYQAKCADCGEMPKKWRATITEQTSWFRGDDEVTFLCISCAMKRKIPLTGPVALTLADVMEWAERQWIAERLK